MKTSLTLFFFVTTLVLSNAQEPTNNLSLAGSFRSVVHDGQGNLYFGSTDNGVNSFFNGTWINDPQGPFVRDMERDIDGTIWVANAEFSGNFGGIRHYPDNSLQNVVRYTRLTTGQVFSSNRILDIEIKSIGDLIALGHEIQSNQNYNGGLTIGKRNGVDNYTWTNVTSGLPGGNRRVLTVAFSDAQTLWAYVESNGTFTGFIAEYSIANNGTVTYNGQVTGHGINFGTGSTGPRVTAMKRLQDLVWLGTWNDNRIHIYLSLIHI